MQEGEKNPCLHLDSLEPAAIRFTLERLQESARQLGLFSLIIICLLYETTRQYWGQARPPCVYNVWHLIRLSATAKSSKPLQMSLVGDCWEKCSTYG